MVTAVSVEPAIDARFGVLDKALTRARYAPDHLIELLHIAQDVFGYLSPEVLRYLARELRLPPSTVYGVATFYSLFSFDPPGDHVCTVCTGTACFVTLSTARCLGSCGMAPVVVVDGGVTGHQTSESVLTAVSEALRSEGGQDAQPD
jgi:bidirectional [NiFe] hydrogenase diaphorase subunit